MSAPTTQCQHWHLLLFFLSVRMSEGVCMHAHMCGVCSHGCTCACLSRWSLEIDLDIILQEVPPLFFLRLGLSLACSSPSRVGWYIPGLLPFLLCSTGIKSLCHYALLKVLIKSLRISYMSTTYFDHLLLYSVLYFSESPYKTSETYVFFLNVNTHRVYSVLSVCTWV